jgi:ribonuclease HI
VFTPFHKPPYPYLYGRSVDETTTGPRQVKLNVDASFFKKEHAGGMGAVLRDYQGNVIAASCKYLPHVASSEMAEAIAMKAGLDLVNSIRCNWAGC